MQWPKAGQRSEEKEGFRGAFGGGRLNLGKIWQMHHFPLFLQNKTPSPMNCSEIGGKKWFYSNRSGEFGSIPFGESQCTSEVQVTDKDCSKYTCWNPSFCKIVKHVSELKQF